jgi:UDP-N-acetylglucosamine 1-carboxyvinyltransferase
MKQIIVNGGKPLCGEITVSGSKNAALPIIFACILTNGISEIDNLPDIGDVRVALDLLRSFGAKIERRGSLTLIDTRRLSYVKPPQFLVEKIRASTYLIGSCLSRFGLCHLLPFGGCNFSLRPIDMHISAAETLGASLDGEALYCDRLRGAVIDFDKPSVGATVNAILLAASAKGETIVRGCAVEPHIDALIDFLNSAGASVIRNGREMHIVGRELHGGKIRVIGDMIEAGSYLAVGIMTDGNIKALNSPIGDMTSVIEALRRLGADAVCENDSISALLNGENYLSVTASPHPGFPTDLQPIFASLMARICGGDITDTVWQSRFGYLDALSSFGVKSFVKQNHANIYKSDIHNGIASCPDLRGGMACLMCALSANGQSKIRMAETILRGYENLEEKLCALGADIKIEEI